MENIDNSRMGTIKQWTPSEQSLSCILSESHYTPSEFVDALGSPSFTALLKSIHPGALPWIRALFIRAFTQEQSGGFKPEEFVPQEVIDRNISELPHLV